MTESHAPTDHPSTPPRLRILILAGTALGLVALAAALVWLAEPQLSPYARDPGPLLHLLRAPRSGPQIMAGLQGVIGAVTAAFGLAALSGRIRAGTPLAVVGVVCGGIVALGFVGFDGIAIAGYMLALSVPVLLLIALAALAIRRPLLGSALLLAALALAAVALLGPVPVARFTELAAASFATSGVRVITAVLGVLFAGTWILCGSLLLAREPGRAGAFVLRHRVAITVLAACCALPYAIARASWLTPWPLFGGEEIERSGSVVLATGLMLGIAMLFGGLLTLGLVLRWGSSFPSWVPRIGGRPVPIALAVVPAMIVAALFTAGGVESLLMLFASDSALPVDRIALVLVLPFWLWGPLLALATWGYAQHRASAGDEARPSQRRYPSSGCARRGSSRDTATAPGPASTSAAAAAARSATNS